MTNSENRRGRPMMAAMAAVNGFLNDLHGSLGLTDTQFFCECGSIGCRERTTLTRAEYARLREEARPVLIKAHARHAPPAPGHDRTPLSAPGQTASHVPTGVLELTS